MRGLLTEEALVRVLAVILRGAGTALAFEVEGNTVASWDPVFGGGGLSGGMGE